MKHGTKLVLSLLAVCSLTATNAFAACPQTTYTSVDFTLHPVQNPGRGACAEATKDQRTAVTNWVRDNNAATDLFKSKGTCPDYAAIAARYNLNNKLVKELETRKTVSYRVGSRSYRTQCVRDIIYNAGDNGGSAH